MHGQSFRYRKDLGWTTPSLPFSTRQIYRRVARNASVQLTPYVGPDPILSCPGGNVRFRAQYVTTS